MKKNVILSLFMIIVLSGCVNYQVPNISMINTNSNYGLTTDDFKIIGIVEAEGTTKIILGIFIFGGDGFSIIYDKAKAIGGDDVIGYTVDLKQAGLFPIYVKSTWKARASVIRFTDRAIDKELFLKNRNSLKITEKISPGIKAKGNSGIIAIRKDITDEDKKVLLNRLTEWRKQKAKEKGVDASLICGSDQLDAIVNKLPTNIQEMRRVSEVPLVTTDTYGEEIINVLNDYFLQK